MSTTNATAAKMPRGIPFILGNEFAERYSYYGMKGILVIFMTRYLLDSQGQLDVMSEVDAKEWYHLFGFVNYFLPLFGAVIADVFLGKYKTVMWLSYMYCLGHLTLALLETRLGLSLGLTFIAIGSGGIKPCITANVGDQFSESNKHLMTKVFGYFYSAINLGALLSMFFSPLVLKYYGPSIAFGIPGILMFIATFIFWLGRKKFVVVPPVSWEKYKGEILEYKKPILQLIGMFLLIGVFWSLFEQTGAAWVLQGQKMDTRVDLSFGIAALSGFTFNVLPEQFQTLNPLFIVLFIPLFSEIIYPAMEKFYPMTPMRRMRFGMFFTALSYVLLAIAQSRISAGEQVSILWQFWAYVIITIGEVMVSVTMMAYTYMQAPSSMKSFLSALNLLALALGNGYAALFNHLNKNADGTETLSGASYFWFFVVLQIFASLLFLMLTRSYKEQTHVQRSEII